MRNSFRSNNVVIVTPQIIQLTHTERHGCWLSWFMFLLFQKTHCSVDQYIHQVGNCAWRVSRVLNENVCCGLSCLFVELRVSQNIREKVNSKYFKIQSRYAFYCLTYNTFRESKVYSKIEFSEEISVFRSPELS